MSRFSREYLFRECALHRHCILLHLNKAIKWDSDVVNEIFMVDMCLDEDQKKQTHMNIANTIDSYGMIEIKAFVGKDSSYESKKVLISTDDIMEIEMVNA